MVGAGGSPVLDAESDHESCTATAGPSGAAPATDCPTTRNIQTRSSGGWTGRISCAGRSANGSDVTSTAMTTSPRSHPKCTGERTSGLLRRGLAIRRTDPQMRPKQMSWHPPAPSLLPRFARPTILRQHVQLCTLIKSGAVCNRRTLKR